MARRIRSFKRIAMTAKTAQKVEEWLATKTLEAHQRKCVQGRKVSWPVETQVCSHMESRSLFVAHAVIAGIKIGSKRGTLDIQCPYSTDDAQGHIATLKVMAERLRDFSRSEKRQLKDACFRIAKAIEAYANRNAMMVIAEAAR